VSLRVLGGDLRVTALFLKDKKMRTNLTQERLKEVLNYDPDTGVFTRAIGVRGCSAGTRLGTLNKRLGYVLVGVDGTQYYAHRLAWLYMNGCWPPEQVDHMNGDRSDNRLVNLRACRQAENSQNTVAHTDSKSGVLGVSWVGKLGKWRARIFKGAEVHLGCFGTKEEAHQAYLAAKAQLHTFQPIPRDLCTSTS
jgi:hypothetical protein